MTRKEAEKIKDELLKSFMQGSAFAILADTLNFDKWFDKTYPPEPEYIPFEYTDFKDFILKEVRRKGENFKDEIWLIVDKTKESIVMYRNGDLLEKMYYTMFEEWEFADGKPFRKIKI